MDVAGHKHLQYMDNFIQEQFSGFFLPVGTQYHGKCMTQLPSEQSIVLADDQYVYKLIVDPNTALEFETKMWKTFLYYVS